MRFDIKLSLEIMQNLKTLNNKQRDIAWLRLKNKAIDIYYNAFYGRLQASSFGVEGQDYKGSEADLREKYRFDKDLLNSDIVYFDLSGDSLYTDVQIAGNKTEETQESYMGIGVGQMTESIDNTTENVEFVKQEVDYNQNYNEFGIDVSQRVQNYVNEYYLKDIKDIKGGK